MKALKIGRTRIQPSKSTIARVTGRLVTATYQAKRHDFTTPAQRVTQALTAALRTSVWPPLI